MEHLNLETLARLVDERPNPEEREHLASCPECATELRALKMQTEQLDGLPAVRPPTGDWQRLEARLMGEGLVHTESSAKRPFMRSLPGWAQAAAAVVIFAGGAGAGMAFAQPGTQDLGSGMLAEAVENVDDAMELVNQTEREYTAALVRLSQLQRSDDDLSEEAVYQRLAALEGLLTAGQEAVRMAPADPAFNGILANVVAERQATIRMASSGNDD